MTIKSNYYGGEYRYHIQSEADNLESIAWFNSLETAATVLRYLKGAPMTTEDSVRAVEAMRAFDAERAARAAERAAEKEAQREKRRARTAATKEVNADANPE